MAFLDDRYGDRRHLHMRVGSALSWISLNSRVQAATHARQAELRCENIFFSVMDFSRMRKYFSGAFPTFAVERLRSGGFNGPQINFKDAGFLSGSLLALSAHEKTFLLSLAAIVQVPRPAIAYFNAPRTCAPWTTRTLSPVPYSPVRPRRTGAVA